MCIKFLSTYVGSGWPSASHSIINGLSLSFDCTATLNKSSSVGGCLMMRGGEFTEKIKQILWFWKLAYKKKENQI